MARGYTVNVVHFEFDKTLVKIYNTFIVKVKKWDLDHSKWPFGFIAMPMVSSKDTGVG